MKIQWEDQYLIIVDNNKSIINTSPYIGELAKLAIISYLVYFVKEGEVEKIHFILIQYATEAYPIPKHLGDVTKLLANIKVSIKL